MYFRSEDVNWSEWPEFERPGAEPVKDRTFARLRWMKTHCIPARLHDAFFLDYREVDDRLSYAGWGHSSSHYKYKKPRAGWLKVVCAGVIGWLWGDSRPSCQPREKPKMPPQAVPYEWNTKV